MNRSPLLPRGDSHAVAVAGGLEVRAAPGAALAPGRLPAAVEVVAYRVALEGMTNAVRHARRRAGAADLQVTVTLTTAPEVLLVTVADDGGPCADWVPGVALTSMATRCDEIGGTFAATSTAAGGRVRARLPLITAHTTSPWRRGADGRDDHRRRRDRPVRLAPSSSRWRPGARPLALSVEDRISSTWP